MELVSKKLRKLPIDVSDLTTMIEGKYIYVDKTELIYKMINEGRFYFLAHPRRFGKSLLVSTLKEIFSGNKKLFNDLWIDKSDYDWVEYPIIHFDFSQLTIRTPETLLSSLIWMVSQVADGNNIDVSKAPFPENKLELLIKELSKKNKVVIVIDEYDYAMVNTITDSILAKQCRDIIKNLFDTIKSCNQQLRFVFLTGITKFSKTSVFSGLNNLRDITLDREYATLLGCTHNELDHYFFEHITNLARQQNSSYKEIVDKMCQWYDGYQFGANDVEKVYNPFSILYYLTTGELKNYWFESATPSFLIELMKDKGYPVENMEGALLNSTDFSAFDIDNLLLPPLFLQTGYLTIKNYDSETENYTLGFPNEEVKTSFLKIFLQGAMNVSSVSVADILPELRKALRDNDMKAFLKVLQRFFTTIPYDIQIKREGYYQTIFYVVLKLLGVQIQAEVKTNSGRIDAVLETKTHIYIIEFKLDGSGEQALQQIEESKYYEGFIGRNKKIILVGVSFDTTLRNIAPDWQIKTLD